MNTRDQPAGETIRVRLRLADLDLAERLAQVLSHVPGIEVVEGDADVLLSDPRPRIANESSGEALLTAREREVLGLLAEGASNKLIARQLGISVHTAKFHVRSLTDKLDATGRTDAVTHAARLGVIHL